MQKYVNLIAFLQILISKEHVVLIMEFPDWVLVKEKYTIHCTDCVEHNFFRSVIEFMT